MRANKSINGVRITERMLLDNYNGITNGGDYISDINGIRVIWTYRRDNDGWRTTTTPNMAEFITLEYDRIGNVPLMSCHDTHPAIDRIINDEARISGDIIR